MSNPWRSFLTDGVRPLPGLNRELMEKFRNAMYGLEEEK
jgi:hypothetical protein